MSNTDQIQNEITITRIFSASRELVWKAWTDPELFMHWWGPKNFTSPACKMDVRVGGTYHWCMRSGEGQEFWTTGVFKEVVKFSRLVYTDGFADEKGNRVPASHYGMPDFLSAEFLITAIFEDYEVGKTKMTLIHAGLPAGEIREMTIASWNESFDKLVGALDEG